MLEPLIVLTVINCLFMFSSTLTTCALWWQHRCNHAYCKRKAMVRNPKATKPKHCTHGNRKADKSKLDTSVNIVSPNTRGECKSTKCPNKKQEMKLKYLSQFSQNVEPRPIVNLEKHNKLDKKAEKSEGVRTVNEPKPAIVMEFGSMEKVVKILDRDSGGPATQLIFRDLSPRRHVEEK